MKHILYFLSLFIGFTPLFSQDKVNMGDEPYPAPVMYNNLTLQEAKFIKQFESTEVSNLHVYADLKQAEDYFFKGKPLDSNFSEFFNGALEGQTRIKGEEPQAVFSIRGEAEELYIIRMAGTEWNHEVALFGLDNRKLEKYLTLAEYSCRNGKCTQMDSWIRDLNGDTRLDVVQVSKKTNKNGKGKIKTRVFLMDQQGYLKKSKPEKINLDNYRMQGLQ